MRYNKLENPKSFVPANIQADDYMAYRVVAVARLPQGWTAYKGPSNWTDEQILDEGDKISEEAARGLFPAFDRSGRHYYG